MKLERWHGGLIVMGIGAFLASVNKSFDIINLTGVGYFLVVIGMLVFISDVNRR